MAAALLTAERVTLHNIPKVRDLITMSKLLAFMDAKVSVTEMPASDYVIEAPKLNHAEAPYELVKTMRASVLTLGPLMARVGMARVSLPGGCAIGARPVDLHLKALEQMGAEIGTSHGYIEARALMGRLKGAHIVFEKITVTGTENILMAAVLADGETVLENALTKFLSTYSHDPPAATRLLNVGESKVDKAIPAPELAAWMLVSSAALNLDAVMNK